MRETWVRSLGQEVLLEKEMATHSSILAWRIPRMEEPGGPRFTGSQRVGHNWVTSLSFTTPCKESYDQSRQHIQKQRLYFVSHFSSVQSLSHVWLFATPWIAAHQASLSITISRSTLKHTSIESWCHPTILSSVVPFFSCPQSLSASESFPMSQLC